MIDRYRLAGLRGTAAIIFMAFVATPFVLVLVANFVTSTATVSSDALALTVLAGLGVWAGVVATLVSVLRRFWGSRLALLRRAPDPTAALVALLNTRMIVELALWEAAVIAGFVAVVVGAPAYCLIVAAAITLAGDALAYPRSADWDAAADALERAMITQDDAGPQG